MKSHLKLGKLCGVEIGLHVSWVVIALLIALSLASRFGAVHDDWSGVTVWISAITTAILFFGGIVVHELAHALSARAFGLQVRSITLFALGGVSNIEQESTSAKAEFWIAFVGPLTSFVVGVLCFGLAAASGWPLWGEPATPLHALLVWLGYINVALAVFNLVPGYPLDGGRILKAIIWAVTGSFERAARAAARVGLGVGVLFIAFGFWSFFTTGLAGGLWLSLIGWFLMTAAGASLMQVTITQMLRDVRVADVMSEECATIEASDSVQTFVDEKMRSHGDRCAVVRQYDQPVGLITTSEVKRVGRDRWASTSVQAVMRSLDRLKAVTPDTPVLEALKQMARDRINLLPVIANGRFAGIVSQATISRLIEVRKAISVNRGRPA